MKSLSHQFLDWARSKPADEGYDFWSTRSAECGCAMTQFAHSVGIKFPSTAWIDLHSRHEEALQTEPWTFGSLVSRLEASVEGGEGLS